MRQQTNVPASVNGFDPYQSMLKRKKMMSTDDLNPSDIEVQQYDVKDIQELENFCQQYGILGFNCGKMDPKSTLKMLKNKMGIVSENVNNKKMLFG